MARSQRKGNGLPAQLAAATSTPRAWTSGPKSTMWRSPRSVTPNRCVALAPTRRIWKP